MRQLPLFALLLLCAGAVAQSAVITTSNPAVCPATVTASRLPSNTMLHASEASRYPAPPRSIGLHVGVTPFLLAEKKTAVAATVEVHGASGARLMQIGSSTDRTDNESFSIAPSPLQHGGLLAATIYTHRLTSVQFVELKEVRYADGSSWREPAEGACQFVPNGFMLVTHGR